MAGKPPPALGRTKPESSGPTIPINLHRKTGWALVELGYCLPRDAWGLSRSRPWLRRLAGIMMGFATSVAGVGADQHLHLISQRTFCS